MRNVQIFSGSSHPTLVEDICDRLGTSPAKRALQNFANGETSVSINTSVRNQDVFIIQSGSDRINDAVMEMLIMISACKGGSAKSITAVMPYFPYSRQSKKKSHRGAITARLLANLLSVAGIHHVITVDLHAPPTQGFFGKPVDNLPAEPLIARWIKTNVSDWKDAVVVSKNPGGTKRVTALADALKLNFGLVTTDRRRMTTNGSVESSMILERPRGGGQDTDHSEEDTVLGNGVSNSNGIRHRNSSHRTAPQTNGAVPQNISHRQFNGSVGSSPLTQSTRVDSASPPVTRPESRDTLVNAPSRTLIMDEDSAEEYTDERAREVITGRLVQGHVVDDDAPSPNLSAMSGSISTLPGDSNGLSQLDDRDAMTSSFMSSASRYQPDNALGGSSDPANHSDDEDEGYMDPELEHTITLVGNVRDRVVLIMDDLIDQARSWIAAAECVVKRGGAKEVYCIATHGLFGDISLEQMEACECIDHIVVTNTYPIAEERVRVCKKLIVLNISHVLSDAIRRNHYGESMSPLFQNYPD